MTPARRRTRVANAGSAQGAAPAVVRIANAQGFWGDDPGAAARLLEQDGNLDFLTLDYLAEVSMSILAGQRRHDPSSGYARDFIEVVRSLAPAWLRGSKVRVITNAGGLNPRACAKRCLEVLRAAGCPGRRIAIVSGDDVLPAARQAIASGAEGAGFENLETGRPLAEVADRLVTANAYLGGRPIAEALAGGADLVITGRVADPSLTVGAAAHHYGWSWTDHDRLAGATVAGHLIECGTQVTGGISTDWLDVPDPVHIGYPIVEVEPDGACCVTKPAATGGRVDERTVKEQLLYELGDPGAYLSPDVTASFLTLGVSDLGCDRVRVAGATGRPAPDTLKVSATYRAGYRASGTLAICGRDAAAKAKRAGQMVLERLREAGAAPRESLVECLGADAVMAHAPGSGAPSEVVLRIAVSDERREVVERFTAALAPLITCGPQGTTGYAEGRPRVHEVFGYWPCLIPRERVQPVVEVIAA